MPSENGIVITIGNNGSNFFLKSKKEVKNDFIENLSTEIKQNLQITFENNKDLPIYVLLDTIEQSYKKKIYPAMTKADFERVARRDLAAEGEKDGLKNYIILKNQNKKPVGNSPKSPEQKKIECIFVTSSNSLVLNSWLEFIYTMPNRLVGIYMLPIESYSFFKLLKGFIKDNFKDSEKKLHKIFCIVTQTNAGGARQMVFSDQGLVFTRIVNYNFNEKNFFDKYSQDLYSTFEYLKRLYVDLTIPDFQIINILPDAVIGQLNKNKNTDLNFINTSPLSISKYVKLPSGIEVGNYCDQIISNIFLESKKILKFSNLKIKVFEGFYATLNFSRILNLALGMILIVCSVYLIFSKKNYEGSLEKFENEKSSATAKLDKTKKEAISGIGSDQENSNNQDEDLTIEEMRDYGKNEEQIGKIEQKQFYFFSKLDYNSKFNVRFEKFLYEIKDFDSKSPNSQIKEEITAIGRIYNESGDTDSMIKKFDDYIEKTKSLNDKYKLTYKELPKNIDFNKKYYEFPVQLTFSNNQ